MNAANDGGRFLKQNKGETIAHQETTEEDVRQLSTRCSYDRCIIISEKEPKKKDSQLVKSSKATPFYEVVSESFRIKTGFLKVFRAGNTASFFLGHFN